ncbi:non-specific serine/threonine protein kinase [Caenorhabditis elegans]|uniref:non-specific serine/threonine protein kinase n=1 Tax=Caenorhabditis elegans TaxID=6239 RepID=O17879_CAEEL|nr:Protein kinase domain-containing protein [Caenorhabditis elegans]CAB04433.4 Protein kinase domain-containing protein [Caenorhabditis elegans]|eukprot:NP_496679.3 Uncharacterized protein CELE_F49C5.4 [Caenorhabditis elegans]
MQPSTSSPSSSSMGSRMRDSGGLARRTVRSDPPTYSSILEYNVEEEVSEAESEESYEKPPEHVPARFVPTQRSDDGGYPAHHHHEAFNRTVSAVSLPVGKQLKDMSEKTQYERAILQLNNDPVVHKEVALGRRIGFYRLGKELGAGNFSKVKLGVHQLTKEKVAVKIMDKAKMDAKAQKLLSREIQAMEEMNHPNIVKLFEVVETLTRVHLVIEYASGGELYTYVHERGKLTEGDAKPLFAQIVSAVSHMHSRNIVHRDIKAENVMFSSPNTVKLVDFGFSCLVDREQMLRTFCGSPPYAAPELFQDTSYAGELVDVWALGVLLFFMLIGVTPFKAETVPDMKVLITAGKYQIPDYVSLLATELIKSMLKTDTGQRADIDSVKKHFWMRDCRFTKSYLSIKATAKIDNEEEKKAIDDKVWKILNNYGIVKEMIVEENLDKGPRDAVVGTYRIVQFQVQSEITRLAKEKDEPQPSSSSFTNGSPTSVKDVNRKLKNRSKTCAIL